MSNKIVVKNDTQIHNAWTLDLVLGTVHMIVTYHNFENHAFTVC